MTGLALSPIRLVSRPLCSHLSVGMSSTCAGFADCVLQSPLSSDCQLKTRASQRCQSGPTSNEMNPNWTHPFWKDILLAHVVNLDWGMSRRTSGPVAVDLADACFAPCSSQLLFSSRVQRERRLDWIDSSTSWLRTLTCRAFEPSEPLVKVVAHVIRLSHFLPQALSASLPKMFCHLQLCNVVIRMLLPHQSAFLQSNKKGLTILLIAEADSAQQLVDCWEVINVSFPQRSCDSLDEMKKAKPSFQTAEHFLPAIDLCRPTTTAHGPWVEACSL